MDNNNSKKTSWGKVASWYDELLEGGDKKGTYQSDVILPNIIRLMDIKEGQMILDLACGQGFFSREFSKIGAKVTASDISKELIKIAKEKSGDLKIDFHASPAHDLPFLKDNSIDKAVIILAIQNIENAHTVFAEVNRVLKKGGEFHIVLNHPVFRIPKVSSWVFDEDGLNPAGNKGVQYRRIDSYMSEMKNEIDMTPGEQNTNKKKFTYSFHRPLQWYFKNLTNTGFLISRLEEWISNKESEKGPRQSEENRIRKEIPMFLYIKSVK